LRKRGARLAVACVLCGLLVLAAVGIAGKRFLLEAWYLHRLGSPDPAVKAAALERLGGLASEMAVPRVAALAGESETLRPAALRVLARVGPASVESLLDLAEATGNDQAVLEAIGTLRPSAVARLGAELKAPRAARRRAAAGALRSMKGEALPATDALVEALGDEDTRVANAALDTVYEIGPPAEAKLASALSSPSPRLRQMAACALGKVGIASDETVTRLAAALGDPESWVRYWAAQALGKARELAEPALPALFRAREDPVLSVRSAAEAAIERIRTL
jgi:HEAT repeat protein